MPIKIGQDAIAAISIGQSLINQVYIGQDLVYGDTAPTNSVPAVASGVGYTGQTLTATAGSWSSGTPTGQWYAGAVAISGATSLSYVVNEAYNGAAFLYRETNEGVTADSNTIHHLVPTDVGVQGWYEALAVSSIILGTGTLVAQWNDLSGNGYHLVQSDAGDQLTYDAANQALVSETGKAAGDLTSMTVDSVITVMQLQSGTETTFPGFCTIAASSLDTYEKRIMGQSGQNALNNFEYPGLDKKNRVNGAAASSTFALPMPKRLNRFEFTAILSEPFSVMHCADNSNRGWEGPVYNYIIPVVGETLSNLQKLEGYAAWSTGVSLVSGHPYQSAPPTL